MRNWAASAFAAAGLSVFSAQTAAIQLVLEEIFFPQDPARLGEEFQGFIFPEGIVFDPTTGDLLLTSSFTDNTAPFPDPMITRVTTANVFVSSTGLAGALTNVKGISNAPTAGNFLVINQGGLPEEVGTDDSTVQEVDSSFTPVAGGISFDTPGISDAEGIVFNTVTGTIFITNDLGTSIAEFATDGASLGSFTPVDGSGSTLPEPTGIAVNPINGNLLVSSDSADGGLEGIFELTPSGEFVSATSINALTDGLFAFPFFNDAEGLSVDPSTNTLYVAFEDDAAVGVFRVAVAEPSTLILLALGLTSLGFSRRRKG